MPLKPFCLKVSAAESAATPPPTITKWVLSLPFVTIGRVLALFKSSLSTLIFNYPLASVTAKVLNPSNIGPISGFPVTTEKAALCQGQWTLSPKKAP